MEHGRTPRLKIGTARRAGRRQFESPTLAEEASITRGSHLRPEVASPEPMAAELSFAWGLRSSLPIGYRRGTQARSLDRRACRGHAAPTRNPAGRVPRRTPDVDRAQPSRHPDA